MKTLIFLLLVTLVGTLRAQEENKNDTNSYRFNTATDIYVATYDDVKKEYKVDEKTKRIFSSKKQIFEKIAEPDSKYFYFRIYRYKESNKKSDSLNNIYVVEDNGDLKTFAISKTSFEQTTTPYYSRYAGVSAGVVTMPFKLRPGDDYESNINIGVNLGFRFRLSKILKDSWQVQPTLGIGISDIPLNHTNSNVTEDQNRTAFTISTGLLLNITKGINIGVFRGWDKLSKVNQLVDWKYQNKGWWGIGINVGFNTSSNDEPEKNN